MPRLSVRALLAPLALLLGLAGCAQVPTRAEPDLARATSLEAETPRDGERARKVFVTGSRIARPVNPRTGLADTFSPVQIYTRHDVLRTGVPGDLGAALYRLDTGFGR